MVAWAWRLQIYKEKQILATADSILKSIFGNLSLDTGLEFNYGLPTYKMFVKDKRGTDQNWQEMQPTQYPLFLIQAHIFGLIIVSFAHTSIPQYSDTDTTSKPWVYATLLCSVYVVMY